VHYRCGVRSRAVIPSACLALLALLALAGCSYSLIQRGEIRRSTFEGVLARTMAARQLYLEEPPRVEVATPESLVAVLELALDQFYSPESLRAYEVGLVALGLWPPERDLRSEFVSVFSGEVAGLYVPSLETIYVVAESPRPLSLRLLSFFTRRDLLGEFVLSHELVHLLQHRAYPELLDPAHQRVDQDDLDNAIQAAIEGDALRYGYEAIGLSMQGLSGAGFAAAFEDDLEAGTSDVLREAPALLRLTLPFPYVAGFPLSLAEGRQLLDRPPASSEQALHATRRHEPFLAFDLRPLREALPRDCAFVHENTLGELHLSVLFRDLGDLRAGDLSPEAWYGWDGDRFLVARCAGALEFVWLTAWDDEGDAAEFGAAYAQIAPAVAARAGHRQAPEPRRSAREVVVTTAGLRGLADRVAALARRRRVSQVDELNALLREWEVPPPP
jgi:hypothetical protein